MVRNLESIIPAVFYALHEGFRLFMTAMVQLREVVDTWMILDHDKEGDNIGALRPLFEARTSNPALRRFTWSFAQDPFHFGIL